METSNLNWKCPDCGKRFGTLTGIALHLRHHKDDADHDPYDPHHPEKYWVGEGPCPASRARGRAPEEMIKELDSGAASLPAYRRAKPKPKSAGFQQETISQTLGNAPAPLPDISTQALHCPCCNVNLYDAFIAAAANMRVLASGALREQIESDSS